MRKWGKILAMAGIIALAAFGFTLGWFDSLTLESLKMRQDGLRAQVAESPLSFAAAYFFLYVAVTALSLPGAAVLTLAGGALFGFWRGLLLVSFASSLGASAAFLLARYLARDWVEGKFGRRFREIQEGFARDGGGYLVFLRLVPAFPFFLVNILSGLTSLSLGKFYLVSQLAMLPGTAVFVNAGTELSRVESLGDILSARLILAFCLLGIFPLLAKKGMELWRRKNAR
jgi:uncharacterized membrane protein YdjX (TVP38/TMEM64 family)